MTSESRGRIVIEELKCLIKEVQESMSHVPGSDRLIRACNKELHHFAKLPPDRLDNAASCSNLPHFRAIVRLAQAYGDRVTGMMCRFRMPPNGNCSRDTRDSSPNLKITEGFNLVRRKPESVLVDLVCVQQSREPITRPRSSELPDHHQQCPGNATDADCWAPSLWIKVVTRDASRLNAAWLGEASSSRAACLYHQMDDLVTTASWYQRGQPANWIRAVIHWLPNNNPNVSNLDPELLAALVQLDVWFFPHNRPWLSVSTPSVQPPLDSSDTSTQRAADILSLRKHMANPYVFHRALREACTQPIDLESRGDSVRDLEAALRDAFAYNKELDEFPDDFIPNRQQTNLAALDATWHLSIRPPFSKTVLNDLDNFPRVNLDVSAMIALASELSHFLPVSDTPKPHEFTSPGEILEALNSDLRREQLLREPRFTCNTLGWLLESEAERAVLPAIHQHIRGSVVVVCRTAALSFLRILVTVAGEHEWFRGLHLLSQVILVPDLVFGDSPSAVANKQNPGQMQTNRRKTQLIMDVGNAFGALTVTANEAFLRSLRNKGLKHAALLVPARALTETAARDE